MLAKVLNFFYILLFVIIYDCQVASGMHKPNKQTVVPLQRVGALLDSLPFSRVQGFGE